jgi:CopG family nickel-responsive transcriptional regulator
MSICRAGREAKIWRSLIAGFLRGANMADLVRTGLSLERELLEKFDETIARRGYQNRSEAIRDLIREHLVSEEGDQNKVIAGTLTMVYDHHRPNLSARLTGIQHSAHTQVLAATHVHLDHHNCLEVVIMKGRCAELKQVADQILSLRGVKHGRFVITTTGKDLK